MVSVQVLRPPAPEHRTLVRRIADDAIAHDGYDSLADSVWRDLAAPSEASTGILATRDGRPVGYAHVGAGDTEGPPHLVAGLVVAPDERAGGAVPTELLHALVDTVSRHGGGRVVLWITGADAPLDAIVRGAGFHRTGELLQMRVPLPLTETPRWPDGVTVHPFRVGADDADWLRVNNRAFRDHPDQGGWNEATLHRRVTEPWFDPEGFLLAYDAEGLAGFCWTKVHPVTPVDPRLGEIFVIGVDPDRHGTGLGRALTVAGLDHLATAGGCAVGMLYVDAANVPALGLYRALGFHEHRLDRAYERGIEAG